MITAGSSASLPISTGEIVLLFTKTAKISPDLSAITYTTGEFSGV